MDERGFSLLEVVVCCAVLSILAVAAGPSLGEVKNSLALRKETRILVSNLQNAKIVAIKENSPVVFQVTEKGYMIFVDSGVGSISRGDWILQPGERLLVDHRYEDGVTLSRTTFNDRRTRFRGRVGMSAGRVVLANASGSKYQVFVSTTGRIRVEKE